MVPKIIVPLLWAPPVQPLACARLEHRWWGAGTMQVPRAGGTLASQPLSGSFTNEAREGKGSAQSHTAQCV